MMSKRIFILLISFITVSLIGIIAIQAYYINNNLKNEKQQFAYAVNNAIGATAQKLREDEYRDFVFTFKRELGRTKKQPDSIAIRNLFLKQEDVSNNETLLYINRILEQDYKLSSTLFDIGLDSVTIKRILSEREFKVVKASSIDGNATVNMEAMLAEIGRMTKGEEIYYDTAYEDLSNRKPIHKRVTNEEIYTILDKKLAQNNIATPYEFAIYSNDLATKVQSNHFAMQQAATYSVPIFDSETSAANYKLYVSFPDRNRYLFSSMVGLILLSIVFTTIIIVAFATAIWQLIKQRKISEIKTDFINNMTHEFKTPIATINLAVDAIKNTRVIENKEQVLRYLNMIKDENKRMHAQVENVLQISKLEKNELNIDKEPIALNDLIEDAVLHVSLLVEARNGTITTHLNAKNDTILANDVHFTNVLVNILDNAIKYSPNAPIIELETQNKDNYIIVKIKDSGSGMSKAAQKRVFEKFYREHTGNIHNVKGHGLGLAYVKRIVEYHNGEIFVESEKNKGSTFTIQLPTI